MELAGQRGTVGIMSAAEQRISLRCDDLVDDGRKIGGGSTIGFIEHDAEAGLFRLPAGRLRHRLGERIVLVDEGDLRVRILLFQRRNGAGEILVGRRVELKQVLVAELIGLPLGAARGDHHLAVLLGNDRGRGDQPRRIGAEQEMRLVLHDQARVELLHARVLRFVIIADQIDLVGFAAGLDAACGIDLSRHSSKPPICAVESLLRAPVFDAVNPIVRVSCAAPGRVAPKSTVATARHSPIVFIGCSCGSVRDRDSRLLAAARGRHPGP